nr:MAG TPA: hypothetical protein [Bacteriophage sp.]
MSADSIRGKCAESSVSAMTRRHKKTSMARYSPCRRGIDKDRKLLYISFYYIAAVRAGVETPSEPTAALRPTNPDHPRKNAR